MSDGFCYTASMTPQEVKQAIELINAGAANLIDVRTNGEWAEVHAKPAVHFDSQRIAAGEIPDLDKTKPVYLYCRSGGRAGRAKLVLENKGFREVHNLGGLLDWHQAGGEVE